MSADLEERAKGRNYFTPLPEGNADQTRIAELERRVATLESVMREIGGLK